jgi:hypothetical protein
VWQDIVKIDGFPCSHSAIQLSVSAFPRQLASSTSLLTASFLPYHFNLLPNIIGLQEDIGESKQKMSPAGKGKPDVHQMKLCNCSTLQNQQPCTCKLHN